MTEKRWLVYAAQPLTLDRKRKYPGEGMIGKPHGLWFSDDSEDSWRSWCESEQFGLDRLAFEHELTFDPWRILVLAHPKELEAFTRMYAKAAPEHSLDQIDWGRIKGRFSGMMIFPYMWECRLNRETGWYYCWDCASGVIWDLTAVKALGPATPIVLTPPCPD